MADEDDLLKDLDDYFNDEFSMPEKEDSLPTEEFPFIDLSEKADETEDTTDENSIPEEWRKQLDDHLSILEEDVADENTDEDYNSYKEEAMEDEIPELTPEEDFDEPYTENTPAESVDSILEAVEEESGTSPQEEDETPLESKIEEKEEKPEKASLKEKYLPIVKQKISDIKAQLAEEVGGGNKKSKSDKKTNENDENLEEASEELPSDKENNTQQKNRGNNNKIFGIIKKISSPFKKIYMFIVNFIFRILDGILAILSKIPFIGLPFVWLRKFSKIIKYIATTLPLLFLIIILVIVNIKAVPIASGVLLPDNGSAIISEFDYDSEKNVAIGKITNTGETIAKISVSFTVHTMQPNWIPTSWFLPKKTQVCKGDQVKIGINSSAEIRVKCGGKPKGFFPRVSGEIE